MSALGARMNIDSILRATRRISNVSDKLDAVKELFKEHPDYVEQEAMAVAGVKLETVYDAANASILIAHYKRSGEALPQHAHRASLEYLISIKGKHLLKLAEGGIRIIQQGECAAIPAGMDHTTVSLSPNAELVAVCIPPELAYRKVDHGDN